MARKLHPYVRKGLKILGWTIGSAIGLFLLVVLLLQIPFFQDIAKDKLVSYVESKIKTPFRIATVEIGLPKKIILTGVYLEDQHKDTLLAGGKLAVDISLFKLLDHQVEINSVDLKNITANITRTQDSVFNFDYIIEAFASKEPKDTTSTPMKISVDKINLDRIRFKFSDAISKNNVTVRLNHFDTRFKKFDLDHMKFDIPNITLDGLKLTLDQGLVEQVAETSVKVADTVSKRPDFRIKLGTIALTRLDLGYANAGSSLNTGVRIGKLLLDFDELDMNKQLIALNSFELKDVHGGLAIGSADKQIKAPETDTTAIKKEGWHFRIGKTDIARVNFKFDDRSAAPVAKGIDYKHLGLQDFHLNAERLDYAAENISGDIRSFGMKDKSGLQIDSLRTQFAYTQRGAYLRDLYVKTPRTLVRDRIEVRYPSLDAVKKNPQSMTFEANLDQSRIGFADILTLVPALARNNPFKAYPNAIIYIDTRVSGSVGNISFPNLTVSGIGNTSVAASGKITGLPDTDKMVFDIDIQRLHSTAKDIAGFVPPGTIPKNIHLPSDITLSGSASGSIKNVKANLALASSMGSAKVNGYFDRRVKNREKYTADVSLSNFQVGRILANDSLGAVTMTLRASGTGLNPKSANATLKLIVQKAEFNHYAYRNLAVNGNISGGQFVADAGMKDPNLTFALNANGGFNDKYPNGELKLNVDIADLEKLHLHAGPMKLKGNVYADIPTADPDYLNGEIDIAHLQMLTDKDPILLDSIRVVATSTADRNAITVKSQILKAQIEGKYKLTQLAEAIQNSISKYYDFAPRRKRVKTDPAHFTFDLTLDNDPVIYKLMPQITGFEPAKITGRYNSEGDTIKVNASVPRLVYGANTISGAALNLDTKDGALNYDANIDQIQGAQFLLPYTSLSGQAKDNAVTYNLRIRDLGKKDQYVINGTMKQADGNTEIRIDPKGLKLNYDDWTIAEGNLLRFGPEGIYADNFELSRNGNILKLQSQSGHANAPLEVTFTDFDLKTLANMVKKEKVLVEGKLNGNAVLKNLTGNMVFTSDLNISGFSFMGEPVGDLALKVDNQTDDRYTAHLALTGNGNQMNLDGFYTASSKSFDLDLDLAHLDVKSVQGFTFGNIKDGSGYLSGKFKVTGTADKPNVNGDLKFNDVGLRVTQLNSLFKGIDETVRVNNQGIFFDTFTVHDEKDNELVVNGSMLTSDFRNFRFNLAVDADNFRAVNSKPKDNDLYYGDLFLDTHLKVGGTMASPVVSGNLKINEDTKFTVVLPQSDPGIAEREGIVEFVDEDNQMLKQTEAIKTAMDQSALKGMDVSVNIQIDKKALLSLIIDKGNGDYLNLKGEADLTGGIDPSGKTTLTGKYEFTEGAYEMTFNLLKRRFDIKPGSYLIWNGEPTSANVDVTAIYKVEAAPIDLLEDQLATTSNVLRNTYKQKLPFQALLHMNGELLKPTISFDIDLPDGNYNVSSAITTAVDTKLAQLRQEPNEMNKQVFALLLLGRFVGENPFSSESGTGAEGLARQSVSKILSQQLNNLAGDLIKGVELNFDLQSTEDYTSGVKENRTDLNVGVSKRLLNDRLKVTVGSTFGVEGQQQPNQQANNIAGDLSADYQLTQDGRYLLRAYRKNQYEVALQGQVIETGVSFIITMDYQKFKELFHRTAEEKEERKKQRERKKEQKQREAEKAKEDHQKDVEFKPVQDEK